MKKNLTPKSIEQKIDPEFKWQTGDYKRHAEFIFNLPSQFLLLCKLMNVIPQDLLLDFMDNLACGSWNRSGRDKAKEYLINYFIANGYGQDFYSEEDIRCIFREMDALGSLFPQNGEIKLIELYSDWRKQHQTYWFKKWFRKPRRSLAK